MSLLTLNLNYKLGPCFQGNGHKAIRARLDMTQEELAGRFGFSVNTLRHWEQGSRQPEAPTRAYILVSECAANAVQKALQAA